MVYQFVAGQSVRRKPEFLNEDPWTHGDQIVTVQSVEPHRKHPDHQILRFDGILGTWASWRFEVVPEKEWVKKDFSTIKLGL
jgi:hypothetical protein